MFGATGDLATRKLIPALFHLFRKKALPPLFQVVGFSRSFLTDEAFRGMVSEIASRLPGSQPEEVRTFSQLFAYQAGRFEEVEAYQSLARRLGLVDKEWRTCANKLFHLSVPPRYYPDILARLSDSGLTKPCSDKEGWTRVIVEKPFGKDLKSAQELDALLGKLFREEQVYRIDHYLGKETAQNVLVFRFSNRLFEDSWHRDSVESIAIQLFETEGVESRGEFYDGVGALRDVGQNHVLQLLALFTMEHPGSFDAVAIRRARAAALKALSLLTESEAVSRTARGQYEGYRSITGVDPRSQTETYFRITGALALPKWQGVPIFLEGGKRLAEAKVEVTMTFSHPSPCLCPRAEAGEHYKNVLRYQIQPHESVKASFWVKKPGVKLELEERDLAFDYKHAFPEGSFLDAYEKLILDAIEGDQTLFVSTEEIMASWKFIDSIITAWQKDVVPLTAYAPGSIGPS